LITFSGRQARLRNPEEAANRLEFIAQNYFRYPEQGKEAAQHLLRLSEAGRDAYFGTHLYTEPGSRLTSNAVGAVTCLWMDEDEGRFPEEEPQPTAIVHSSATRRHLYWRLERPVTVEWAVAMNRRLAVFSSGDIGKAGLASVLRAPSTRNYKRHPVVDDVRMTLTGADPWSPEIMEQAIPELPEPQVSTLARTCSRAAYDGPEVEIEEYLEYVEVFGEVSDGLGTKYAIRCPWINEHTGKDPSGAYLGKRADGGFWYHCHHAHCAGRTWEEFRFAVMGGFVRVKRPTAIKKEKKVRITRG